MAGRPGPALFRGAPGSNIPERAQSSPYQSLNSLGECLYDSINNIICLASHLIISRILNRVGYEYTTSILQAKCPGLDFGRFFELNRSHCHRWNTLNFKPYRVMQTARGTGASVGQGFDHKVVLLPDLPAEFIWRRFGKCWFCISIDFHTGKALL